MNGNLLIPDLCVGCGHAGLLKFLLMESGMSSVAVCFFGPIHCFTEILPKCSHMWMISIIMIFLSYTAHFRSPRWGYLLWRSQLYECYYMYITINAIRGFSYIFYTRLTQFSPKMEVKRSSLNPTFLFFVPSSPYSIFSFSSVTDGESLSPRGSQSLWMRPHVNHRLSCDGSCQWRASHMGLASELVCNPPSPASEVPHGSLLAFGLRIAAADRAGWQERRERCESRTQRLARTSIRAGRVDVMPTRREMV